MRKPATTAVTRPLSGVVPDAIAIAMASGRATMATVTPAIVSAPNLFQSYPSFAITVIDFGMNMRQLVFGLRSVRTPVAIRLSRRLLCAPLFAALVGDSRRLAHDRHGRIAKAHT